MSRRGSAACTRTSGKRNSAASCAKSGSRRRGRLHAQPRRTSRPGSMSTRCDSPPQRAVRSAVSVLLMLAITSAVAAEKPYPSRPVRMIVPFPPGGGVDGVARIIGPKLTERWGQQVVVDNRPGGNTIVGNEALVKSAPDGYTLIIVSSAHVINHFL